MPRYCNYCHKTLPTKVFHSHDQCKKCRLYEHELAVWLEEQKRLYKLGALNPKIIQMLEEGIPNFSWD